MARQALVLDASVGVKWFSAGEEASLSQALAIRDSHIAGQILIMVPDLFFYEVADAIIHKKSIPLEAVQSAVDSMFDLGMEAVTVNSDLLGVSAMLSRKLGITVYDACYMALAQKYHCPLVTANPRHQKEELGSEIILVEKWRRDAT
jgi:predicted nucleic acid-binding protein